MIRQLSRISKSVIFLACIHLIHGARKVEVQVAKTKVDSPAQKACVSDASNAHSCTPSSKMPRNELDEINDQPENEKDTSQSVLPETILIIQPPLENVNKISVTVEKVTFFSNYDNGNLAKVKGDRQHPDTFKLWIGDDCKDRQPKLKRNNQRRLWFQFTLKNVHTKSRTITLSIENIKTKHYEFFKADQEIFMKKGKGPWQRHRISQLQKADDGSTRLMIKVSAPPGVEIVLALTQPWTYEQNQLYLARLQIRIDKQPSIYLYRELLCNSLDKLRVEMLTLTSMANTLDENESYYGDRQFLFPESFPRPLKTKKPIIFMTCRAHPGEAPTNYILKGVIDYLTKEGSKGQRFLDEFVLLFIPMLNPDGVLRGHDRLDSLGYDLNRVYNRRYKKQKFPAQYAVLETVKYYGTRIAVFIDLHAHTQVFNTFVFHNSHPDPKVQSRIEEFPEIIQELLESFTHAPEMEDPEYVGDTVEQYEGHLMENQELPPDEFDWHPSRASVRNSIIAKTDTSLPKTSKLGSLGYMIVEHMDSSARAAVFSSTEIDLVFTFETHYKAYNMTKNGTSYFKKAGQEDFEETGRAIVNSLLKLKKTVHDDL